MSFLDAREHGAALRRGMGDVLCAALASWRHECTDV